MNQNLPKPMLEALGRQPLPTDHPSADVLTAFAENALVGDEYRRTADHLSRCGECREIAFLASSAADKPLQVEEQVAAPYAAPRRRMPRLVWGMSIAAGLLVVASSLMWWRNESARTRMQMASREVGIPPARPAQPAQESQAAIESKSNPELKSRIQPQLSIGSKSPIAPDTTAELAAPSASFAKSQDKTPRAKNVSPQGAETHGMGASAGIVAGAIPAPAKAVRTPAATKPATIAISAAPRNIGPASTTAPATPHANSFAPAQGGPLAAAPRSADELLLNPQVAVRSLGAAHLWRITADGHLEHSTAEGWTRVLADQSATFHVVSVVGNQVWVGGSRGALFHSHDEGQNWEQVALTTLSGRETDTIVSIQFDDVQHGIVTTDSGASCSTTDGGGSWSCQ
jgi:hypothetical protein